MPAARAARLTAAKPGISGPRTGSMMASESSARPTIVASPPRMPATCGTGQLQRARAAPPELGGSQPLSALALFFFFFFWWALTPGQDKPPSCSSVAAEQVFPDARMHAD